MKQRRTVINILVATAIIIKLFVGNIYLLNKYNDSKETTHNSTNTTECVVDDQGIIPTMKGTYIPS